MPKLRNGGTDLQKFAQWLGRKCRNHNPLAELEFAPAAREKLQRMYKAKAKGEVGILENTTTLVYEAAGRTFLIEVSEVEDAAHQEEIAKQPRVAVGY